MLTLGFADDALMPARRHSAVQRGTRMTHVVPILCRAHLGSHGSMAVHGTERRSLAWPVTPTPSPLFKALLSAFPSRPPFFFGLGGNLAAAEYDICHRGNQAMLS
jgi:hypothetical protein